MHVLHTHTHGCLQSCYGHPVSGLDTLACQGGRCTDHLLALASGLLPAPPLDSGPLRPGGWGGGFPALLWSLFPLPGMEPDEVSNHRSLPIPSKHVILLVSEHLFRFFLVQAPLTQAPSLFSPRSSLQELLKAGCGPLLAPLAGEEHSFLWELQELCLRLCWFVAGSTLSARRNPVFCLPTTTTQKANRP